MKPTPTEYKGVRFRSKSEAMFAFHLDKASIYYEYENGFASEIHNWDFYAFWCDDEERSRFYGGDFPVFIEYKPVKPTTTYIQNLKTKIESHFEFRISAFADEIKNFRGSDSIKYFRENKLLNHFRSQFWIVFGSPFNPAGNLDDQVIEEIGITYESICLWPGFRRSVSKDPIQNWLLSSQFTEECMKYRFDLKH